VEEFLSTILSDSGDPKIAVRLRRVIDELQGGADLEAAAKSAGLDLKDLSDATDSQDDQTQSTKDSPEATI
jgi:hypothetical protein